jgi:hypothetical protein
MADPTVPVPMMAMRVAVGQGGGWGCEKDDIGCIVFSTGLLWRVCAKILRLLHE